MSPPLLAIESARIEAAGAMLAASLSLSANGPRIVAVGDTAPLLAPLLRRARLAEGSFRVDDVPLEGARASLGLAPLDPPLPADMSVVEYVAWSARLAGLSPREALSSAKSVCARAGLGDVLRRGVSSLPPVPRRLAVLAQAAAAPAKLVVVEHPLEGLDDESARFVLARLGAIVGDANVLVSTGRFTAGSPGELLAKGATTIVVLAGGRVLEAAPPAEIRSLWPRPRDLATSAPPAEPARDADETNAPGDFVETSAVRAIDPEAVSAVDPEPDPDAPPKRD